MAQFPLTFQIHRGGVSIRGKDHSQRRRDSSAKISDYVEQTVATKKTRIVPQSDDGWTHVQSRNRGRSSRPQTSNSQPFATRNRWNSLNSDVSRAETEVDMTSLPRGPKPIDVKISPASESKRWANAVRVGTKPKKSVRFVENPAVKQQKTRISSSTVKPAPKSVVAEAPKEASVEKNLFEDFAVTDDFVDWADEAEKNTESMKDDQVPSWVNDSDEKPLKERLAALQLDATGWDDSDDEW